MKNINVDYVDYVDYSQKDVDYQARNHCHDRDHCQYHCWDRPLSGWNCCKDKNPGQDGEEHADGKN